VARWRLPALNAFSGPLIYLKAVSGVYWRFETRGGGPQGQGRLWEKTYTAKFHTISGKANVTKEKSSHSFCGLASPSRRRQTATLFVSE
jgi:hypothetical protein